MITNDNIKDYIDKRMKDREKRTEITQDIVIQELSKIAFAKVADKKTESNKPKVFKVGDIIELKNLKVTVNKVHNVKGNEFSKPKDRNEFIAVDCTVENISKEEQGVSSLAMFKVVDKDGRACEYSLTGQTAANAGQMDGQIAPGRKLTVVYVVEVPKGTKGLELEFDSSLILGGQVIVKLNQ